MMISPNGLPDLVTLIALALATMCVSWMMAKLHGPLHLFEKLRQRLPLGGLLACWLCLSVWWAFVFLWLWTSATGAVLPLGTWLILIPSIAGGAWLLAYQVGLAYAES